ncbi:MAG: MerR family transcriptional regulator [Planctomycetota bacterium]
MARLRLPEKRYRIGEVIEHSGLSRQTVHLYTQLGLIREAARTASGYRLYPPEVFAKLEKIRAMQRKGYTLARIREILTDPRHAPRLATATKRTERTRKQGLRSTARRNTPSGGKAS